MWIILDGTFDKRYPMNSSISSPSSPGVFAVLDGLPVPDRYGPGRRSFAGVRTC